MKSFRHYSILILFLFIISSRSKAQEMVEVAKENGRYFFQTKTDIAYGADGKYAYKYGVTGWITFDNATFGDPAPGFIKSGYFIKAKTFIRIYENANYEGPYTDLPLSDLSWIGDNWNDKISSVRVPEGYMMIGYEHINFGGASIEIKGDWTLNPQQMQWNDRISSFKLVKLETVTPVITKYTPFPDSIYVRAFDNPDYTGAVDEYRFADAVLNLGTFDKKIGSVQVRQGYKIVVYENRELKGNSIEISGNWSSSDRADWDNRISSFKLVDLNKPVVNTIKKGEVPAEISFLTQFVQMSTKNHGGDVRLDFSPVDKKFKLQQQSRKWKFVPLGMNKYKILLQERGKYWALSSTPASLPVLEEDTSGIYQSWQLERLDDGYYKISNVGLVQKNSSYASLFCDAQTNELFIGQWQEKKTLNGRWSLSGAGSIPAGDQPDLLDGRYFSLIAVSNNKSICLQSYLAGGDVRSFKFTDCKGKDGKIHLIKTFNGDYFIRMNQVPSKRYHYLNDRLMSVNESQVNILNPDPKLTWIVKDVGYGVYIITNTSTGKVFDVFFVYGEATLRLTTPANKDTERWYLR